MNHRYRAKQAKKMAQKRKTGNGTQRRGPKKRKASLHTSAIGHKPGTANSSKSIITAQLDEAIDTRDQNIVDLTAIPHTTDNSIDGRTRDTVYVGGWRVTMTISNEQTVPLYFNYAVISPRTSNVVTNLQFFRYYDDFRAADFSDALTALEFGSLPINADKYHIHMHRKCLLAPASGSTNEVSNMSNSYKHMEFWVPFKRELRYSGGKGDTGPESGATYLVYWCDTWQRGAQGASQAGVCKTQVQAITHFRDVGSMY